MTPRIQALDDAFEIVHGLMFRHKSAAIISFLCRIESYLLSQSRAELRAMMEGK